MAECFVPGTKKKPSNRIVPIHDNRKWSRENANERRTSTFIPNTINGRRLLKATTKKEEESKPVYDSKRTIFMISGQNIENSVCSAHPNDPELGTSKIFVKPMELSLENSQDHPSLNANSNKKENRCSKIEVKIGKNTTHTGSEICTETNLDEINDQGSAQNSSGNSFEETNEKNFEPYSSKSSNELCHDFKSPEFDLNSLLSSFDNSIIKNVTKQSKKSIMTVNRFPKIKHQSISIASSSQKLENPTCFQSTQENSSGINDVMFRQKHSKEPVTLAKTTMRHQETRNYCSEKEDEDQKSEKGKCYLTTEIEDRDRRKRSYAIPSLEKMNQPSSIESESSDKSNIKEAPGSSSGPKSYTNFSRQQHELNTILLETGGFEINKMESCHDPIENCIDFNRLGIDVSSEKTHFENKPLFSVYGMSHGC